MTSMTRAWAGGNAGPCVLGIRRDVLAGAVRVTPPDCEKRSLPPGCC
jgi:hypothetical protein